MNEMNKMNIYNSLPTMSEYEMLQLDYDPHLVSVDAMNAPDVV